MPPLAIHEAASLRYIQWDPEFSNRKPFEVFMDLPEGYPSKNFRVEQEPQQVIEDIRGKEQDFKLDEQGFCIRKHMLDLTFFDRDSVQHQYLPQIEAILKKELGPNVRVHVFDWRLRSSDECKTAMQLGTVVDLNDPLRYLKPIQGVHIDQSEAAARQRVRHHMSGEATDLLKGRVRIINVWRPLRATIEDWPLALCDGSSVPSDKLLTVDHVRRNYVGESLYPLFSEEYKWHYLSGQTKDEVLLLKIYDSSVEVKARRCPHTSFKQSRPLGNKNPRETIEVRVLVFSPS